MEISRKRTLTKLKILGAGFIPGALSALAIKLGINLKERAIGIFSATCHVTKGFIPLPCLLLVSVLPLIFTLITLYLVFRKVKGIKSSRIWFFRLNSWLIALLLYIAGFILGTNVTLVLLWWL